MHQVFVNQVGGGLNNNQPIPETSFLGVLKQRLLSFIFRGIWNEESDQTMVSDGGMLFRLHSGHLGISSSFIIVLGYWKLPSLFHLDNLSDLEFLCTVWQRKLYNKSLWLYDTSNNLLDLIKDLTSYKYCISSFKILVNSNHCMGFSSFIVCCSIGIKWLSPCSMSLFVFSQGWNR